MTSPATPEHTVPALSPNRDIRPGAHQVLLTANGRDTFYLLELQRAITGYGSPLARFLPAANYLAGDRAAGKSAGVTFTLAPADIPAARPLRCSGASLPGALALTRSEIDAFRQGVKRFLSTASDLTPLQQQCRRDFRLPDPVREPDAYWVIGSGFDRRLIILWGCERFARTSVPLDRVVAHLETCEMGREDKYQLGLQLALKREEPLSRFLGLAKKDGTGLKLNGDGQFISAKTLKRFTSLGRSEFASFDAAALAYAAKALDPATSSFEAEIRREFVLPSLGTAADRFLLNGSRLLIDASMFDLAQGVPPAPLGDEVDEAALPLNRQLASRVKFQGMPYVYAGGGLAAAAALSFGFIFFGPDRAAPLHLDTEARNNREIAVRFSEPLSAAIPADAIAFVGDSRKIAALRRDPADSSRLIVVPEAPLADGEAYALDLTGALADGAGNALVRTTAEFKFLDSQAPRLVARTGVSAGGRSARDLVLTFDKPLDQASLTPSALSIRPVSSGEAGRAVRIERVEFDSDAPEGTRVIVTADEEFKSRRPYQLDIRDFRDRAVRPNRVQLENFAFEYKDILAPGVREVVAAGSTYTVQLQFSKPVDPATALAPESYEILPAGMGAKPLQLLAGGLSLDEVGSHVTLRLERTLLSPGQHKLIVKQAADRQGNRLERPLERSFAFGDAGTRGAPVITERPASDEQSSTLSLVFDRGLSPAAANDPARFRILNSDGVESGLEVKQAVSSADDTRRVTLTLSRPPRGGELYYVRTQGLEDIFGTRQTEPATKDFRPLTMTIKPLLTLQLSNPPRLRGRSQVTLRFNDVMTSSSVGNVTNYRVLPQTPIQRVEHKIESGPDGRKFSEVTLHFSAPITGEVKVGANNLAFEGDVTGQIYRIPPRPAVQ
jgi:hypothetical protein